MLELFELVRPLLTVLLAALKELLLLLLFLPLVLHLLLLLLAQALGQQQQQLQGAPGGHQEAPVVLLTLPLPLLLLQGQVSHRPLGVLPVLQVLQALQVVVPQQEVVGVVAGVVAEVLLQQPPLLPFVAPAAAGTLHRPTLLLLPGRLHPAVVPAVPAAAVAAAVGMARACRPGQMPETRAGRLGRMQARGA